MDGPGTSRGHLFTWQEVAQLQRETGAVFAETMALRPLFTRINDHPASYWLAGGIGVLALLLTISGIYGMLSYAVARRTQEIGVRIALGASSGRIVEMIVRQSLRLCAFGLAIGLAAALGVSKLLSSVLVMMHMFDLPAFAAGIAIVVAACLAAAVHPARRAARIEPLVALRYE